MISPMLLLKMYGVPILKWVHFADLECIDHLVMLIFNFKNVLLNLIFIILLFENFYIQTESVKKPKLSLNINS